MEHRIYNGKPLEAAFWLFVSLIGCALALIGVLNILNVLDPQSAYYRGEQSDAVAMMTIGLVIAYLFARLSYVRSARVEVGPSTVVVTVGPLTKRIHRTDQICIDRRIRLFRLGGFRLDVLSPFESVYRVQIGSGAWEIYVNLDQSEDIEGEIDFIKRMQSAPLSEE